jgi:hypothetical protein
VRIKLDFWPIINFHIFIIIVIEKLNGSI